MIIEVFINTALFVLTIIISVILAPIKLIFPSFSTNGMFTGVISEVVRILGSVDDLFIYFSSSEAWRFLMLCCFLSFVILPLFSIAIGFIKMGISILRG